MVKNFSDFLAKKFIKNYENFQNEQVRAQYGILEGWISIILNFVLGLVKIVLAVIYGSVSLMADAVHTLSDMTTSMIIIFSFNYGQKPGDRAHPFGHGRMEQIATLVIAILLIVSGVELARNGIERIQQPEALNVDWISISIIGVTIFFKEWLGQVSNYIGKKINSMALEADSWHHRTDAISSLLVVIALIAAKFGFPYLDGAIGILIGGFVIYLGWDIARQSVDILLGTPPDKKLLEKVSSVARSFKPVLGVHDLIVHQYGIQTILSCHLEVPDTMTLSQAHTLAEKVESGLAKSIGVHATIHIDPVMPPSEESRKLEKILSAFIESDSRLVSFHDLRMVGESNYLTILLDLVSSDHLKDTEKTQIKTSLARELKTAMPGVKSVQIYIEPKFAFHVD